LQNIENRLLIVVFSFNRAMQLDCLLRTTIERLKYENCIIKVIFHAAGNHVSGYKTLIEKFKNYTKIKFIALEPKNSFWTDKLPLLFRNRNLWRYCKHKFLRKPLDNFKQLTESIIKDSECEFCMFLTDDGYFYKDVIVPEIVFDKIKQNPFQVSYRMYIGKNLSDCPKGLEIEDNLFRWDYYDSKMKENWAYPFSVDVTIYHSIALLRILQPVFYHTPTTLESFVVTHCRTRKLLSIGYSPLESNYLGLIINRVSTIGNNLAGNINIETLNSKYIEGYTLDYEFPIPPKVHGLLPSKIILSHVGKEQIIIEP
jgi:hypothetical protein